MTNMEEDLKKLINKIAEEHEYKNHEIILNETSSGGANFTSKLYTVIVKESNRDDLHLFVKVANVGEKFRSNVGWQLFSAEFTAYTKLWNVYTTLEEENGVPEEHKFLFAKCYGCDPTLYQETIVLENLNEQGFSPYDRFTGVDWEYASSAATELAKFHALSFAFSEKYPADYENILADIKVDWKEGSLDNLVRGATETALETVEPKDREALEKFLKKNEEDLQSRFFAPIRRTAIVHGDFRGSNLMHKVREVSDDFKNIYEQNFVRLL